MDRIRNILIFLFNDIIPIPFFGDWIQTVSLQQIRNYQRRQRQVWLCVLLFCLLISTVISLSCGSYHIELSDWLSGKEASYFDLYHELENYCEQQEVLHLCGLSLGGILALHYAVEHAEKVASLVLIGTQYIMPKRLLKFQNMIFHLMPNRSFRKMGFGKKDFRQ